MKNHNMQGVKLVVFNFQFYRLQSLNKVIDLGRCNRYQIFNSSIIFCFDSLYCDISALIGKHFNMDTGREGIIHG